MHADIPALSREWTQTGPKTYERAVDDLEKLYLFFAGIGHGRPEKQNWHTTTAIKVETEREGFVEDVKEAWKALRYDHPNLSAVVQDGRWIYHVADEQELCLWLQETFYVHDVDQTARQLYPFNTNPSTRAVLHVLPRSQELVLQAPHTHVDGIGMVTAFDRMMRFLVAPLATQPNFGKEGSNLIPPLSITAEVPKYTVSQKQTWDSVFQSFISQFPSIRVHTENIGEPARKAKLQWLTFTADETARIVARSKELGFSVTAAVQAAISHAAIIHGQTNSTAHTTLAIYNAREYINPQLYPHQKLVGPHVFALPAVIPVTPDSFIETARQAKQIFIDYKKDGFLRAISPVYVSEFVAALSAPPPPEMPVPADLQLSSLGVMNKYIDPVYWPSEQGSGKGRPHLKVQDLWIALDILTPDVAAEVWTFNERLVIQLIYNEAFHREESITYLLGLIQEQLTQGLGLNLGTDTGVPGDEGFLEIQKANGKD
ncbi:hypothetical protein MGYG_02810 [Nannizzia gypsea CBS 118893]|uniref:Condensation domain-containing protein n=1 Tax=Arthroderma gypseum (strain ATCC MYA-4604 / CBS 118893) TaxID=535722 RepID=E4UP72_ARTGP|nr:hypothetical protein MGYG_02810 [Nannizzia gypsea CBS 118893]EFQ99798.1 hypothetical protein MGYG_02810 [Nannizzia gypsea CBS 118893]